MNVKIGEVSCHVLVSQVVVASGAVESSKAEFYLSCFTASVFQIRYLIFFFNLILVGR
jgi:hypothetical protein